MAGVGGFVLYEGGMPGMIHRFVLKRKFDSKQQFN